MHLAAAGEEGRVVVVAAAAIAPGRNRGKQSSSRRSALPPLSPRPWKRARLQRNHRHTDKDAAAVPSTPRRNTANVSKMAIDAAPGPASATVRSSRHSRSGSLLRSANSSAASTPTAGSRRSSRASGSSVSSGSRGSYAGGRRAAKMQRSGGGGMSMVPPSPSRSALDPQYAGRLSSSMRFSPAAAAPYGQENQLLVPPPSVERSRAARGDDNLSIFRPPSIETGMEDDGDATAARSSPFETPDRRATGGLSTSVSQSPSVSSASAPFASPTRHGKFASYFAGSPSDGGGGRGFYGGGGSGGGGGTYSPAGSSYAHSAFGSPRGTPSHSRRSFFSGSSTVGGDSSFSSRGTERSASGINSGTAGTTGYSDRFIPSRASSNLNFSVWDGSDRDDDRSCADGRRGGGGSGSVRFGPGGEGYRNGGEASSADDPAAAASSSSSSRSTGGNGNDAGGARGTHAQSQPLLNVLLRSELLGENVDPAEASALNPASPASSPRRGNDNTNTTAGDRRMPQSSPRSNTSSTPLREGSSSANNFLRYQSPRQSYRRGVFGEVIQPSSGVANTPRSSRGGGLGGNDASMTDVVNSFHLSPVGSAAGRRLAAETGGTQKRKRRIPKVPFKVLDAPALQDDFYLNLVDWSSLNVLAVGLGSCVYLWSACTSKVTKLCDLAENDDVVTSVSWTQRGTHLAVGTNRGEVQIWDTVKCRTIRTMSGHGARVGTLSWSGPTLASGSRDRVIHLRDVRSSRPYTARLASHKQEVCGLKWSPDETPSAYLASGGNDNKLLVWDVKNHSRGPVHRFAEHTAAVKAIAWSPHQHGLLASGGGTADRCIRFWNALSGSALNCVDTGSQVCNLAWSRNCNELVSTHGYSLNQIVVWRYPTMTKVTTLTGHTYRVLYLAMSPDGSTVVTGAGDETLRFWNVFPAPRSDDKSSGSGLLFPSSPGSVIR